MEELILNKTKILELYKTRNPKEQELLEDIFGQELFKQPPGLIIEWKDLCQLRKWHPLNALPYPKCPPVKENESAAITKQRAINAFHIIDAFRELYNTDPQTSKVWVPDWNNSNEYKYYPYFEFKRGVGFSFGVSLNVCSATSVGSRLVYKTRELSDHAGKALLPYYQILFNL